HRSYIVNKQKVTAYTKQDVEIGEIEIPIGDLYKESALKKLKI
ncbi:MAG: two-component system LytT family response regulator, partial [Polaribacter sp.]